MKRIFQFIPLFIFLFYSCSNEKRKNEKDDSFQFTLSQELPGILEREFKIKGDCNGDTVNLKLSTYEINFVLSDSLIFDSVITDKKRSIEKIIYQLKSKRIPPGYFFDKNEEYKSIIISFLTYSTERYGDVSNNLKSEYLLLPSNDNRYFYEKITKYYDFGFVTDKGIDKGIIYHNASIILSIYPKKEILEIKFGNMYPEYSKNVLGNIMSCTVHSLKIKCTKSGLFY